MRREIAFHGTFLFLFAFSFYHFFQILEPFLTPILGAIVLAIMSYPLHAWLRRRLFSKRSTNLQAFASTLLVLTLIVGPFLFALWGVIQESQRAAPTVIQWVGELKSWQTGEGSDRLISACREIRNWLPEGVRLSRHDLQKYAASAALTLLTGIRATGRALAANVLKSAFHMLVVAATLFFLFRDGLTWLDRIKRLLPLRVEDQDRLLSSFESIVMGIVRGSLLTALFQMICATIGYLIVGLPGALLLGMLTGVAAFIPVIGTSLVWGPAALYLLLNVSVTKGVLLFIWGGVLVSLMDNVVRTLLIGQQVKMPLLLLFFGLVGGLSVYGLRGLLIGPFVVSVIPIFLDIFEHQYLRRNSKSP